MNLLRHTRPLELGESHRSMPGGMAPDGTLVEVCRHDLPMRELARDIHAFAHQSGYPDPHALYCVWVTLTPAGLRRPPPAN